MQSSDIWRTCLWLIFRWGTTKKRPSLSKRWTLRRGCSWCTGPTPAGRSNWRRTQTSRRNLKRLDDTLSFKLWQEEDRIFFCESYVFCPPCIRSCQKMPSSTGLTSTSLQKKSAHTHIGMCTSDLHGAYFAYCIPIPHLLMTETTSQSTKCRLIWQWKWCQYLMRGHKQLQPLMLPLLCGLFFFFFCKPVCVFLLSGAVTARRRQWVYSVKLVFGAGGTTFCVDQCSVFGMSWRKCSPRSVEPM